MANATTRQAAWLYSRLHGDATLLALLGTDATHTGIYQDDAGQAPLWPAVVFTAASVQIINSIGPDRCGVNALWHVKAIGTDRRWDRVQAIMDRVDTLLQTGYGTPEVGAITSLVLEGETAYAETDAAGQAYRHLLHRYRAIGPAA
jgi:hypothetical protein